MLTKVRQNKQKKVNDLTAKWYDIPYPASAYIFPRESLVNHVRFDSEYIHFELTDGRILSIPLKWVPSLYSATRVEREKFEISPDRTMIIWDPDKCAINDEIRIADYLTPKVRKARKSSRRTKSR